MALFETPEQALQAWLDGVNAADVRTVTSLYQEDAVLLPTFSNKRLTTPDARWSYFERVASKPQLSVELHRRTLVVQRFCDQVYGLCGIYLWRFEDDEDLLSFEARFTFTMELGRPDPILHHHSSQIPRTI